MILIELEDSPSQEFGVGDNRVRLNYNYLVNLWSFSLFDIDGNVLRAGDFLYVGANLLARVNSRLIVSNSVSCPSANWYDRLITPFFDSIPQTVLVYDV